MNEQQQREQWGRLVHDLSEHTYGQILDVSPEAFEVIEQIVGDVRAKLLAEVGGGPAYLWLLYLLALRTLDSAHVRLVFAGLSDTESSAMGGYFTQLDDLAQLQRARAELARVDQGLQQRIHELGGGETRKERRAKLRVVRGKR